MGGNQPAHAEIGDPQKCNEKSPPGEECQPIECAPTSPTVPSPWPDRPALRGATARGSPVRRSPQGGIIPARARCTSATARAGCATAGSSPLARGALEGVAGVDVVGEVGARIIPARAGCTPRHPRSRPAPRDHPRSRGVHATLVGPGFCHTGSSPLARGALTKNLKTSGGIGIIPARAGCTGRNAAANSPPRDHPRSRGVHLPSSASRGPWRDHPRSRGVHAFSRSAHLT